MHHNCYALRQAAQRAHTQEHCAHLPALLPLTLHAAHPTLCHTNVGRWQAPLSQALRMAAASKRQKPVPSHQVGQGASVTRWVKGHVSKRHGARCVAALW